MNELTHRSWDVIVVGTGMGGATIGYALAKAGKKVLFCEKGRSSRQPTAIKGQYPEEFFQEPTGPSADHCSLLANAGRNWNEIIDESLPKQRTFIPFIGAGTGGSSALYGMALERFFPEDFEPGLSHPGAKDSNLPKSWPISHTDLVPYYESAERLYGVRGEADSLRGDAFQPHYLKPPPLTPSASRLMHDLRSQGCHPYRLPQACEFEPECACCQGYLCPRECKNDSNRMCLEPALREHGAELLEECEVVRLEADAISVTGVVCNYQGMSVTLYGNVIILAAGALYTPAILLSSRSSAWPDGLANRSGLVGGNLMRHFTDLYVLRSGLRDGLRASWKEVAFNDYYSGTKKLGSVQSFGALPPASQLVDSVQNDIRAGSIPFAGTLFSIIKPLVQAYLERMLAKGPIIASIIEDLPYFENRIQVDASTGQLRLHYRIRATERERIKQMRDLLGRLLKPFRPFCIRQAENNERLAHVCGTCRFGEDPALSVLDANNRAHDVDNLYVVDASFFPSSGGINPALTIAANALRVADKIALKPKPNP